MIPILYEKNEKAFLGSGLCRLHDCTNCVVTEERNGIYECDFDYPVDGANFEQIRLGRIIAAEHDDTNDVQPFDIVSYTKPINGIVSFHAVHISYRQSKIIASGSSVTGLDAVFDMFGSGLPNNPFTYWTDKTSSATFPLADGVPRSVREMLGGTEGSVLDTYGGEYEWDKFTVKLWSSRGEGVEFVIRYGVNMTEYEDETDSIESFSAIVPYWIGNENDTQIVVKGNMVTNGTTTVSGRVDCVAMDFTQEFESDVKPTASELEALALSKLNSDQPNLASQSIKVGFIRLQDTGEYGQFQNLLKCKLCDSVRVEFPRYNMSGRFKIVKTVYDVLLERYTEMELGTLQTTLSEALGISSGSSSSYSTSGGGASYRLTKSGDIITLTGGGTSSSVTDSDTKYGLSINGHTVALVAGGSDSSVTVPDNFTTEYETKLNGIEAGAEVNVQSDWNVTDATSDAYIKNKPTIPSAVQPTTTTPKMDGTASVGSEAKYARGDHVHPTDTSRASQSDFNSLSSEVLDVKSVVTDLETAVANKVDKVTGKGLSTNDFTTAEKNKLSRIADGAEINQHAFSYVKVSGTDTVIEADSSKDSLVLSAGSNIAITPDATNDKVTIAFNGTIPTLQNNFGIVKVGSTNVEADTTRDTLELVAGSNVTLTPDATNDKITIASLHPTYTTFTGKPPVNQTPSFGDIVTISQISQSASGQVSGTDRTVKIPDDVVTSTDDGLMSSDDKNKLDGIESGAEVNVNADWNATSGDAQILNKPTLATVATSGSYNDLSNKPTIPQVGHTIPYGYCQTAAGTAAKVVTVSPSITELTTGLTIAVRFQYANTVANPTLNVNSLGAVKIYRYGTTAPSTSATSSWNAQAVVMLTYNGTGWILNDWNNTTYSGMTDAEYKAGTSTTNRLITPARLKAAVILHAPVTSVNGSTGDVTVEVPDAISDLTNDMVYDLGTVSRGQFTITEAQRTAVATMWAKGLCAVTLTNDSETFYAIKERLIDYGGLQFYGFVGSCASLSATGSPQTGTAIVGICTTQNVGILAVADDCSQDDIETIVSAVLPQAISIDRKVTSGTNIADITIGNTTTSLYAPSGGSSITILDCYPIGSYYETSNTSFNPNTAWGGKWELDNTAKQSTGNYNLVLNRNTSNLTATSTGALIASLSFTSITGRINVRANAAIQTSRYTSQITVLVDGTVVGYATTNSTTLQRLIVETVSDVGVGSHTIQLRLSGQDTGTTATMPAYQTYELFVEDMTNPDGGNYRWHRTA